MVGMKDRPGSAVAVCSVVALAIVAGLLVIYSGCYIWLSDLGNSPYFVKCRTYDYRWQAVLFWPAGQVEREFADYDVIIQSSEDP
jgi:hypothetical protein